MMVPRSHRVAVCDLGREGVVAKKQTSFYHPNGRDWVKVKNPRYWRRDAERGAMMRGSTSIGRALASSEAPTRKRRGPRSHQPVTRARMLSASHVSCGRVPRASLPSPYPVPMRASLVALRFYDGRGRAGCPVRRAHPSPQPPRRITSRGTPAASASAIAAHHRVSAPLRKRVAVSNAVVRSCCRFLRSSGGPSSRPEYPHLPAAELSRTPRAPTPQSAGNSRATSFALGSTKAGPQLELRDASDLSSGTRPGRHDDASRARAQDGPSGHAPCQANFRA